MKLAIAGVGVLLAVAAALGDGQAPSSRKGVALSELAWPDAEAWLTPSAVVVLPLGAGALEQGPHMKLDSDERLARHLVSRVIAASAVVVAPALNYYFYSAYADYPGSTSLSETSARDDHRRRSAQSGAFGSAAVLRPQHQLRRRSVRSRRRRRSWRIAASCSATPTRTTGSNSRTC